MRMGEWWVEFDTGVKLCLDREILDANTELNELEVNGGRVKDICSVRDKIKELAGYCKGTWRVGENGKAYRVVWCTRGEKWENGDQTFFAGSRPRLPPTEAQVRAVLDDLGVTATRVAKIKRYHLKAPRNAHRGEYRKAKEGVGDTKHLWSRYIGRIFRDYTEHKRNHLCLCGCGEPVDKYHLFSSMLHRAMTERRIINIDLGIMDDGSLSPKLRQYYRARKKYPWLRMKEFFKGR